MAKKSMGARTQRLKHIWKNTLRGGPSRETFYKRWSSCRMSERSADYAINDPDHAS